MYLITTSGLPSSKCPASLQWIADLSILSETVDA